jgi:quinol monooxygenase YgiN
MQPVVKNAKSRETEPGCQAYYFFTPRDGNGEVMWGIEMYIPPQLTKLTPPSYDDEKAIKETHFNSPAFQNFAAYTLSHEPS